MIEMRRTQLSFGDGLIAAEVSDLREGWMKHADVVLSDETIVAAIYEALAKRHPKSRCRGRRGAPAETVLRLLILKHIRSWSYEVLERAARQPGLSGLYPGRRRQGAGRQDDGATSRGALVKVCGQECVCYPSYVRAPLRDNLDPAIFFSLRRY